MLILENILHGYKSLKVIDGISLSLAPGQILCLTGPSGCGKTTLLKIIAGLIAPRGGKLKNLFSRTSYVFQEPRLLPWRTTLENIAFGLLAKKIPTSVRQQIAFNLAKELGIEQTANQYPHQLSGGMQQRVALGRALAVEPDLLLLDEPFSNLDIGRRRQLQDLMLKLLSDRNLAALVVSHNLAEAVRLGNFLVILSPSPSRVVYQWKPKTPPMERDNLYINEAVSKLLAIPQVANCFDLETSS
ncbi:MAG: ATP-binding cassette domain-containing protein [Mastigocoleus sp. MO_167.B18]|nr:ATP-binding cassette domain-containing protein [Mastigocoleus sp. MO_167.B18]